MVLIYLIYDLFFFAVKCTGIDRVYQNCPA